jgi:hypothetical protein
MNATRKIFVLGLVVALVALPGVASPQRVIYTVCQWFNTEKNCYRCSDYFTVRSEQEAQRRCRGGTPYYFPSVGALFGWMQGNCTCGPEE